MNNSVFGKTMENLRNRVDIKIVNSNETNKIRKLVASPLYARHVIFTNDLVGIDMRKSKISLSPFDSKRWIDDDGIQTKAYRYTETLPTFTDEELEQMEAELSELLGW